MSSSNDKLLADIVDYLQNLHDRVKIIENWIIEYEVKHNGNLTQTEEKVVKELIDKENEMNK